MYGGQEGDQRKIATHLLIIVDLGCIYITEQAQNKPRRSQHAGRDRFILVVKLLKCNDAHCNEVVGPRW